MTPQTPAGTEPREPVPAAQKPKRSRARTDRGMKTQLLVAEWFKDRGWPYAESTGSGRRGVDVTGMPGISVEVKATASESLPGKLRQAVKNANGGLPIVVYRPNGMGEQSMKDWPVILPLGVFTLLLRAAGYGSEQP